MCKQWNTLQLININKMLITMLQNLYSECLLKGVKIGSTLLDHFHVVKGLKQCFISVTLFQIYIKEALTT